MRKIEQVSRSTRSQVVQSNSVETAKTVESDEIVDGLTDGWMDGGAGRRTEGQMDGRVGSPTNRKKKQKNRLVVESKLMAINK